MKLSTVIAAIMIFFFGCSSSNNYYIDDKAGLDSNSGLSPQQPWQSLERINSTTFSPGDSIHFKAGGVWNGFLWPKGSGSKDRQITVSYYGKGKKPLIKGNGNFENVVQLENQEYWTISNLEITNSCPDNDVRMLRGVYVSGCDYGTLHEIYLKNLEIHDVNGILHAGDYDDNLAKDNGGIVYEVTGNFVKTRFDGFYIINCKIYNVDRSGISNKSSWKDRSLTENINWYPNLNVIIRNNWIERTGGNGLIIRAAKTPLIEYNVFKQCGLKVNGNAMFPFNCDDALFQYNEAFLTVYNEGDFDASGFDADFRCKRTVFQYNYSHDNDGGFMVVAGMGGKTRFNDGNIIRYNISQNDGGDIFLIAGQNTNTYIYNNVIYSGERKPNNLIRFKYWKAWSDSTHFYNNIFYNLNAASFDCGESTSNFFDSNVFYGGHPEHEPDDQNKIIADPQLVNPGSGGNGINNLAGYMLKKSSPCINSGILLNNHVKKDFYGKNVPNHQTKPDRGVCEYYPGE